MKVPWVQAASNFLLKVTFIDADTGEVVPLTGATALRFVFDHPTVGAASFSRTAALFTDGSDGIAKYEATTSDFTAAGKWFVQGYAELPSGKFYSKQYEFKVLPNIT